MTVLHPQRFVAGGEVLARHPDGRAVFVRGALPGETVDVVFTTDKRDWARADAVAVVSPSVDRVVPACRHRLEGCGGCDWMHVAVGAQLPAKASIVEEALRRTGKIESPNVRVGAAVPSTAYRTTIRVAATADGRLGFRAAQSHDIVATPGCLVAHPRLAEVVATADADPGVEATLRVSAATGEMTARWNRRAGELRGLPPDVRCGADASLDERVHGTRLRVSAGSFFQSGPAAAELVVDTVRDVVPESIAAACVADLYAGVGLLGACLASPGARVVAVESSRRSAEDARHNLAGHDARVLTGEVADVAIGEVPDVVFADPARDGLGKPGTSAIARIGAPVVALVSCDPVAMARDAALLARYGYRLEQVTVIDLFPQTHHVEAVSRFVLE